MGKKKNVSMTHEEIWDDSALMQSWDDAVDEYQQYHSIHAKGENVEEVLKAAEESGSVVEAEPLEKVVDIPAEKDVSNAESEDVAMVIDESVSETAPEISQPVSSQPVSTPAEVSTAVPPMPHPVMATVKDESLKNLMMSWYYAGYYTGLHEGQQQASQGKGQ